MHLEGRVEFRILGPSELVEDGRQVVLAGGRQRTLLALLLLHANEVVSSDRLIDGLWGERPPATAAKVLQNVVSQLRRSLGDGVVVTRAPGYLLQVEPQAVDAHRFQALLEEGQKHARGRRARRGRPAAARRARAVARAAAGRVGLRTLRRRRRNTARGAAPTRARGADRGRPRARTPRRPGRRARTPRRRSPPARTPPRPAHARPLPIRPTSRSAPGLPRRTTTTGRRARAGARNRPPTTRKANPHPASGARPTAYGAPTQERAASRDRGRSGAGRPPACAHTRRDRPFGRRAADRIPAHPRRPGAHRPPKLTRQDRRRVRQDRGRLPGRWLAFKPAIVGDYVFVSSEEDDILSRIDVRTGEVDTHGRLPSPAGVAAGADGSLWVGTFYGNHVSQIDAGNYHLLQLAEVPRGSQSTFVTVGGGSAWVAHSHPAALSRFSAPTGKLQRRYVLPAGSTFTNEVAFGEGATWTAVAEGWLMRTDVGLAQPRALRLLSGASGVGPWLVAATHARGMGSQRTTALRIL